jgi:hypothetical protein
VWGCLTVDAVENENEGETIGEKAILNMKRHDGDTLSFLLKNMPLSEQGVEDTA